MGAVLRAGEGLACCRQLPLLHAYSANGSVQVQQKLKLSGVGELTLSQVSVELCPLCHSACSLSNNHW